MFLAYIRHSYNLILFSYCNDILSWPIFWNILPHCSRVCSLLFVHSGTERYLLGSFNLFPRPLRRSGIVYDSLLPIDLMGHFTAFSQIRVVRPLCGLLAHVSSENFHLGASLRNFCFGSYFCLLDRFAAFGLLALDGLPYGLRSTIT